MRSSRLTVPLVVLLVLVRPCPSLVAQSTGSTRVSDPTAHHRTGERRYPYRTKIDYVLAELDLRAGDVIVDIGAGDGWWSERFAKAVGEVGVVHAAEVDRKQIDRMREKFTGIPQIRPYLCEKDDTTLAEDSCDLAFFSQSFHHLELKGRIDYLRHLKKIVKPTGRVVIIEKYSKLSGPRQSHGTNISALTREAEEAGWILVRYELMLGTYHYLATLVQKDLFPPEPERRRRDQPRTQRF